MHITNENHDCCFVTMFVHTVCNFKCSYCNDFHNDGSYRWPTDWEPYLEFIQKLKQRKKHLYIDLLGGEPTLWPKFQEFINTITDENVFIEFGTNGSRTLRYWEDFNVERAFVFLSWHYEFIDDDHFYNVAKILQDKVTVSVPLMVTPDNFERAKIMYDRLKDLRIEITPKFVRTNISGFDYYPYTDEQKEWIVNNYYNKQKPFGINWKLPQELYFNGVKKKFNEVLDSNMHKFEGYTCTAGINRIVVDPSGNVLRCNKRVGGSLGNIFKNNYVLPDDPIVCDKFSCPCKSDAIVEKWKY